MNEIKVIILAAGEGKRLRPLTENKPKCLVEIFGKSILEWQLEIFRKAGISNIHIVTGYQSEKITFSELNYFKNKKYSSTNMVETLFCAKEELEGSVIVSYGDIIFESKVIEKLLKSKEDISVIIDKKWNTLWNARFDNPLNDAESLQLDKSNNIVEIGKKVENINKIQGQFIGLMKFQGDGVEALKTFYEFVKKESKKGKNILNENLPFEKSYMTDLIQGLIDTNHKVKAVLIDNGWIEIDSYDDYKTYEKMKNEKNIKHIINLDL